MRRHRRRLSARYALPCVTPPWRRARRHARSLARAKVVNDRRRRPPRGRRSRRRRLARRAARHAIESRPLLPPRPPRQHRRPRARVAGRRFPALSTGFNRRSRRHRPPLVRLGGDGDARRRARRLLVDLHRLHLRHLRRRRGRRRRGGLLCLLHQQQLLTLRRLSRTLCHVLGDAGARARVADRARFLRLDDRVARRGPLASRQLYLSRNRFRKFHTQLGFHEIFPDLAP